MNFLIIGGLLAFGILALVGAIFLGLSEQRATSTRNNRVEQAALPDLSRPVTHSVVESPTMVRPNLPASGETTFSREEQERRLSALNGQFHEVVGEIRTLHQQALQLEQRLGVLTEIVDRIERSQSGHTSIEEESFTKQDNTRP